MCLFLCGKETAHEQQVTKEVPKEAAAKHRGSDGSSPVMDVTANGSITSPASTSNGPLTDDVAPLPAVSTLLDFVAWVVLGGLPTRASRLAGWAKGRGGFLADELGHVHKASVRMQVRRPCRLQLGST